jgi:hypothetical protein
MSYMPLIFLTLLLPYTISEYNNGSKENGEKEKVCLSIFYCYLLEDLCFYDLPPFLATLSLVFLLADASPFLLAFFLATIISGYLYP